MNKIILLISFSILFADTFKIYTYSIKENYKEYINSRVIDKDYSSWSDILGVGITYTKEYQYFDLYINSEIAGGSSIYTSPGDKPILNTQKGLTLINVNIGNNFYPYIFEIGYRYWKRGYSKQPGDYDEVYYWTYFATGLNYKFFINKSTIFFLGKYKYAFNPKLKVYLGNEPILNLGDTTGIEAKIEYQYHLDNNYDLGFFYKYSFWEISKSNEAILRIDNKNYTIFEPDSITRNQYLGIFLEKSF